MHPEHDRIDDQTWAGLPSNTQAQLPSSGDGTSQNGTAVDGSAMDNTAINGTFMNGSGMTDSGMDGFSMGEYNNMNELNMNQFNMDNLNIGQFSADQFNAGQFNIGQYGTGRATVAPWALYNPPADPALPSPAPASPSQQQPPSSSQQQQQQQQLMVVTPPAPAAALADANVDLQLVIKEQLEQALGRLATAAEQQSAPYAAPPPSLSAPAHSFSDHLDMPQVLADDSGDGQLAYDAMPLWLEQQQQQPQTQQQQEEPETLSTDFLDVFRYGAPNEWSMFPPAPEEVPKAKPLDQQQQQSGYSSLFEDVPLPDDMFTQPSQPANNPLDQPLSGPLFEDLAQPENDTFLQQQDAQAADPLDLLPSGPLLEEGEIPLEGSAEQPEQPEQPDQQEAAAAPAAEDSQMENENVSLLTMLQPLVAHVRSEEERLLTSSPLEEVASSPATLAADDVDDLVHVFGKADAILENDNNGSDNAIVNPAANGFPVANGGAQASPVTDSGYGSKSSAEASKSSSAQVSRRNSADQYRHNSAEAAGEESINVEVVESSSRRTGALGGCAPALPAVPALPAIPGIPGSEPGDYIEDGVLYDKEGTRLELLPVGARPPPENKHFPKPKRGKGQSNKKDYWAYVENWTCGGLLNGLQRRGPWCNFSGKTVVFKNIKRYVPPRQLMKRREMELRRAAAKQKREAQEAKRRERALAKETKGKGKMPVRG